MFKATEVERKIREINLLIDLQVNLSQCRNSDHYFSVSPVIVIRTHQELKCIIYIYEEFLEGKKIMAAEKMQQESHLVYLPEIPGLEQSSMLGRLHKNHWNTMTACMQHPYGNGESGNSQQTISLVCKITSKQIVEVLFQCF